MSYTALYRKFRPLDFENVRGQEHIVRALRNQLASDRISHAYLFCGTRGTGKTTVAKILARSLNCTSLRDGSPCGECAMCRSIADGSSLNVREIDAASNNRVDDARTIIESVEYSPPEGGRIVYIIDEVHMLTGPAFNALLKTLEEPPSYCVFILATTDPQKLPATILSRCQRYDFHRISASVISARMQELISAENMEAESAALDYISRVADGSMRDALSLLDQCLAFNYGEKLTLDMTAQVLGTVDNAGLSKIVRLILSKDIPSLFDCIDLLLSQGRELSQLVLDLTYYFRNLMLLCASPSVKERLTLSPSAIALLEEEAKLTDTDECIRCLLALSKLTEELRLHGGKRIYAEIALVRLCIPEQLQAQPKALPVSEPAAKAPPEKALEVKESAPKKKLSVAVPEDIKELIRKWNQLIGTAESGMGKVISQNAVPSLSDKGNLILAFSDRTWYEYFEGSRENKERLAALFEAVSGHRVPFVCRLTESRQELSNTYPDLRENINFEIEEIE